MDKGFEQLQIEEEFITLYRHQTKDETVHMEINLIS